MKLTDQDAGRTAGVQTREEANAALAGNFAGCGWTPEAMRAAERMFGPESPVAAAMESSPAGRQAEAGELEAGA